MFEPPNPPRDVRASDATADSVRLRWSAPKSGEDEGKRFWYTISYKTRTPQRRQSVTVIDFVTKSSYVVRELKSFTLYEFSVQTTTRYGQSRPAKCQEYTGEIGGGT